MVEFLDKKARIRFTALATLIVRMCLSTSGLDPDLIFTVSTVPQ